MRSSAAVVVVAVGTRGTRSGVFDLAVWKTSSSDIRLLPANRLASEAKASDSRRSRLVAALGPSWSSSMPRSTSSRLAGVRDDVEGVEPPGGVVAADSPGSSHPRR